MSLSFNGSTSKLLGTGLTAPGGTSGGPFTIFAWVKPSGTQNQGAVLGLSGSIGANTVGIQIDDQWGTRCGGYGQSGAAWYAEAPAVIDSTNWQPLMFSVASNTSRKAYYRSASLVWTDDFALDISTVTSVGIGDRPSAGFPYSGLIAHAAFWKVALSDSDFTALAGGAAPSSIQAANLVDYWTLATQAATQTGVNGRVLTATSTSQGATDPPVSGGGGGGGSSKAAMHYYRLIGAPNV